MKKPRNISATLLINSISLMALSCSLSANISGTNKESNLGISANLMAPMLALQSPGSPLSKSLTPTLRVSGINNTDVVSIYSDASCSTLVATQTSAGTTLDFNLTINYSSNAYYAKYVTAGGLSSNCSSVLPYTSNFATGVGFPLGKADAFFEKVTTVATDASNNVYTIESSDVYDLGNYVFVYDSNGVFKFSFGTKGSGNGQLSGATGIGIDTSGNIYIVDSGNDRVQKFNSSGVYQSQFGSTGAGNGQFNNPVRIGFDSIGNIFIADSNRIQKFNSSGVYLSQFGTLGTGNAQFNGTGGFAFDSAGNIFVADTFNNRVQKLSSSGGYISEFPISGRVNSVKIDSSGNVFAVNETLNQIEKYTSAGIFISQIGGFGINHGQLSQPREIAFDSADNIYVADSNNNGPTVNNSRIEKFNSSGVYQLSIGAKGNTNGQLNSPYGITLDASGNIYVADTYNNRVQKFDSSGVYQMQFGSSGSGNGQFNLPKGLTIDAGGNIYVADTGNNRVQKFNSSGVYVSQFGSAGATNGLFSGPYGIALDSGGNIYVTDNGNNRVQKFNSAGAYLSQFGTLGTGNGQFTGPTGIAIDGSGNLLVCDDSRFQKFNSATVFVFQVTFSFGQSGIALDSSGNIFVTDGSEVRKFSSAGAGLATYGGLTDRGVGGFASPQGIAFDTSGNFYVVDATAIRVQKFNSAGVVQVN